MIAVVIETKDNLYNCTSTIGIFYYLLQFMMHLEVMKLRKKKSMALYALFATTIL
jgi:hypothetical protein